MLLIFIDVVVENNAITKFIALHNFVTKFRKILETTKQIFWKYRK